MKSSPLPICYNNRRSSGYSARGRSRNRQMEPMKGILPSYKLTVALVSSSCFKINIELFDFLPDLLPARSHCSHATGEMNGCTQRGIEIQEAQTDRHACTHTDRHRGRWKGSQRRQTYRPTDQRSEADTVGQTGRQTERKDEWYFQRKADRRFCRRNH